MHILVFFLDVFIEDLVMSFQFPNHHYLLDLNKFRFNFSLVSIFQLAYLPYKRRDLMLDDANIEVYIPLEGNVETADDVHKEEKKSKKNGLLNWLKPRVCCSGSLTTLSHTIIIDTSRYLKISVILRGKTFLGM